ncbi:hypothetical protein F0562_011801 [Nyssa sinensis]|uniref:RNase H type-1 domain-containing protein n=1 Tax=Nyssa sinensis TaxID=561372 RepID=A0A5J4ZTA9_9ASTE|nr:hypothetical protein F0562_011801 [Nyssa sinensis]
MANTFNRRSLPSSSPAGDNKNPRYHIAVVMKDHIKRKWRLTGFYGNPETAHKSCSWDLLKWLHIQMDIPWICLGDFNEILSSREKAGFVGRVESQMRAFHSVLDDCGFKDLGFNGQEFTQCNKRGRKMVGLVGVIRDYKGDVIGGFAKSLGCISSAEYGESMTMLHGILFVKDMGIQDLMVESYCLSLVSAMAAPSPDLLVLENIFEEIKYEMGRFVA